MSRHAVSRSRIVMWALAALVAGLALVHLLAPPARTIYVGGPILTMAAGDGVVGGLAVEGERIAAVGSEAEIRAWGEARGARVVELGGHALLSGFVDAHSHFPAAGLSVVAARLESPPVGNVERIDDLVARLRARAGQTSSGRWPSGRWVWGLGYDDTLLAERRHPTRADLDRVASDRPVAALHVSGHLAVVNGAGLARLGIDAATPDPEGGRIVRDPATGEPTGVLEEEAARPLLLELTRPGPIDALRIARRASAIYLAAGVTTAQNGYATLAQMRGLVWLSRLGLVPLRLVLWPGEEEVAAADAAGEALPAGDGTWVRVGAVKLVADGSIQGYTGYLTQPYFVPPPPGEDPSYRGYPRIPREALFAKVAQQNARGRQLAIHANGDASIDDVLDALEAARRSDPRPDWRPVIVHAQMAREDQLDRMAALGAIPSFFGLHVWYWGDRHRDVFLGPERAARISPAASAARRGLRFTLHADTPVVPMEPLRMVHVAVNRRTASGAPLGTDQRIPTLRALRAVTLDAAYEQFLEGDRGSLEPGKLADLVILDRSPLDAPGSIDRIRVLETVIAGRTVWHAP